MNNNIKKTVYIDRDIEKKLKIKAVLDEKTESETLSSILSDYFTSKGNKYSFSAKKREQGKE